MDQGLPRPPPRQGRRRPPHPPRAHHRHRHRVLALPPRPHTPRSQTPASDLQALSDQHINQREAEPLQAVGAGRSDPPPLGLKLTPWDGLLARTNIPDIAGMDRFAVWPGARGRPSSMTVLTMLLLRYTGERTALKVAANAAGASGTCSGSSSRSNQPRAASDGGSARARASPPGARATSSAGVPSGSSSASSSASPATAASSARSRAASPSACFWAIFGLAAGALYGLWGMRGVRPAPERDRAAATRRQLGDPRVGRRRRCPAHDHRPVEPRYAEPDGALQPRGARSAARRSRDPMSTRTTPGEDSHPRLG